MYHGSSKKINEFNPDLILPDDHLAYDNSEKTIVLPGAYGDECELCPMHNVGTKSAGRLLDGVLHDAFPVVRP